MTSIEDFKLREKQISSTFSYFVINNALLYHFLANWLAHNKKMTEKSVFREACDWSSKITPLSNLTLASLRVAWNANLQQKQNWTAKYTNLKENAGNIKSVSVIRAALWAEKLGSCLENCKSLKKYPRKTCGCGQPRGHLIRVLNERSVNDGGDICLLWLVILKAVSYSVRDTF